MASSRWMQGRIRCSTRRTATGWSASRSGSGEPFEPYGAGRNPESVRIDHFSPTTLNDYLKCPRLYWYNHHPGLVDEPRSVAMERGGFLHEVLQDYHEHEEEWRPLEAEQQRQGRAAA